LLLGDLQGHGNKGRCFCRDGLEDEQTSRLVKTVQIFIELYITG
jgi:hypothetical protein